MAGCVVRGNELGVDIAIPYTRFRVICGSHHTGLIRLNFVHGMTLPRQMRLFEVVLEVLSGREDLNNQARVIWEAEDGSGILDTYDNPLP